MGPNRADCSPYMLRNDMIYNTQPSQAASGSSNPAGISPNIVLFTTLGLSLIYHIGFTVFFGTGLTVLSTI